jgi:hypothetical protein
LEKSPNPELLVVSWNNNRTTILHLGNVLSRVKSRPNVDGAPSG